jgi:hypothetical protein
LARPAAWRERPASAVGRKTENVVPMPSVETKVMNPQCALTIERAVESPRPAPAAHALCREERVEDLALQDVGDAGARVGDVDPHESPGTASGWGRGAEADTEAGSR